MFATVPRANFGLERKFVLNFQKVRFYKLTTKILLRIICGFHSSWQRFVEKNVVVDRRHFESSRVMFNHLRLHSRPWLLAIVTLGKRVAMHCCYATFLSNDA